VVVIAADNIKSAPVLEYNFVIINNVLYAPSLQDIICHYFPSLHEVIRLNLKSVKVQFSIKCKYVCIHVNRLVCFDGVIITPDNIKSTLILIYFIFIF